MFRRKKKEKPRPFKLEKRPLIDCDLCGEVAVYSEWKVYEDGFSTSGPYIPKPFVMCDNCKKAILKTIGRSKS